MNNKRCQICDEVKDLYCSGYSKNPFIDGKCYYRICFSCYHVPKTVNQIYDKDGSILEEMQLPFSHKNIHTMKELVDMGASENFSEAKKSVKSVVNLIKNAKPSDLKKQKTQSKEKGVSVNHEKK